MIDPKPKTVLELFENHPERWTQGYYARTEDKRWIDADNKNAVCWCLTGAILLIYNKRPIIIIDKVASYLPFGNIATFNDHHTFEEVLAFVREVGI